MSKIVKHFYVHVPYCKHLCNYCDFYKERISEGESFSRYEKLLSDSLQANRQLLDENGFVLGMLDSLYLGGGTPSLWGQSGAAFVRKLIDSQLSLSPTAEVTLEVDPDAWTEQQLIDWKNAGVNRWSIGLQSQSDRFLEILDRKHRWDDALALLGWLQDNGENYSVDFMLSVPNSKTIGRNIENELDQVLALGPGHISLYLMEVRKHYPHYDKLPEDDYASQEYLRVVEHLEKAGFDHYEVSNFARPGHKSLHNQAYWAHKSVAGIGPSATGLLNDGQTAIRYKWKASTPLFQIENLTQEQMRLEKFFVQTRVSDGVNYNEYFFGENLEHFMSLMAKWVERGWVKQGERMSLTAKGMLNQDTLFDEMFQMGIL